MPPLHTTDRLTRGRTESPDSPRAAPAIAIIEPADEDASSAQSAARSAALAAFRHSNATVHWFRDASAFWKWFDSTRPDCVISELHLRDDFEAGDDRVDSDDSGHRLLVRLRQTDPSIPLIFLTQSASVAETVRVIRGGAADVVLKSDGHERWTHAIAAALTPVPPTWGVRYRRLRQMIGELTPRQRIILDHVCDGLPTKTIATRLGLSKRLIEIERSRILRQFGVATTPELTLIIGELRVLKQWHQRIDAPHHEVTKSHEVTKTSRRQTEPR